MRVGYIKKILLTIFIVSQSTFVVLAQNSKEEKYYTNIDRHWLAEIPLWVPAGNYDLSSTRSANEWEFKRLNTDVGLDFYFAGRIAAKYDKLWGQLDAFSGEVSSPFSYTSLSGNEEKQLVNIRIQSTVPRLVLGYSVYQKSAEDLKIELIPHIGVKYASLRLQSDDFDSTNVIDARVDLFEPLIGLYVPIVYKRFKIEVQLDYGVTSTNNSWLISNRYRYGISKLIDVELGWDLIRLYYNGIVGGEEIESTIRLFGPAIGIGFRF